MVEVGVCSSDHGPGAAGWWQKDSRDGALQALLCLCCRLGFNSLKRAI